MLIILKQTIFYNKTYFLKINLKIIKIQYIKQYVMINLLNKFHLLQELNVLLQKIINQVMVHYYKENYYIFNNKELKKNNKENNRWIKVK